MDLEQQLLDMEQRFWKGDAAFYREHLIEGALMVFAEPVGVLTKEETVDAIAAGPRWAEVAFDAVHTVRLGDDAVLLTYRATARRSGDGSDYTALTSSVYVRRDSSWRLAFHQQTPSGDS